LDSVKGGLNDIFADYIGLQNTYVFDQPKSARLCKLAFCIPKKLEGRIIDNVSEVIDAYRISRYSGISMEPRPKKILKDTNTSENKAYLDKTIQVEEVKFEIILKEKKLAETIAWLKQNFSDKTISYETFPFLDRNGKHGLGRMGNLPSPLSLEQLARTVQRRLNLKSIRMVGDPNLSATKIAVCTGSGAGFLNQFIKSGAQVYITGDVKYHDALIVKENQKGLIDVGHYASEQIMIDDLTKRLQQWLYASDINSVIVKACHLASDPFVVLT
jgi:putative NIF3 family GTP cyclohydrolase 1 type 2